MPPFPNEPESAPGEIGDSATQDIERYLEAGEAPSNEEVLRLLVQVRRQLSIMSWEGPLPPPEVIEQFEEIYPGAAEIIFTTFRDQAHHRMQLETTVVQGGNERASRGLWLAFIVVIALIGLAAYLAYLENPAWSIAPLIIAIGGAAAIFYEARIRQRAELRRKAEAVPAPRRTNPNDEE